MEPLREVNDLERIQTPGGARKSASKKGGTPGRRRSLLASDHEASPLSARKAASRLNSQTAVSRAAHEAPTPANILDPEQVSALYHQCIKLATENKITGKNTWALGLIDHLHDLVQPNEGEGSDTNFQRASVTLGAGVEIYAKRVDSVHTEAYKVLGGLSRGGAAGADPGDEDADDEEGEGEEGPKDTGKAARRAAMLRDVNPSSTLEASFDTLNVKKFDMAFTVDPLFHKTSAQFDEGGAKGLLLNNLSVFRGCHIFFDSQEIPDADVQGGDCVQPDVQVDLTPLRNHIDRALGEGYQEARICPALDELYSLLGCPVDEAMDQSISRMMASIPEARSQGADAAVMDSQLEGSEVDMEDEAGMDMPQLSSDEDDLADALEDFHNDDGIQEASMVEDVEGSHQPAWMTQEDYATQDSQGPEFSAGGDELGHSSLEFDDAPQSNEEAGLGAVGGADAVAWLVSGVENLNLDGKAWAGASHWRYRTRQNPDADPDVADAPAKPVKKSAGRKRGEPLDFNNLPELAEGALDLADVRQITLKSWGSKAPTLLPEDLHYKASSLAELFLKPGQPIFEAPAAAQRDRLSQAYDSDGECYGGEETGGFDDEEAGEGGWRDVDFGGAGDLIEAPRKVAQIGINYARASKQVDVRALKQSLWHIMGEQQDSHRGAPSPDGGLSFQSVLSGLSADSGVDNLADLSVHLCFICTLHLANEHGLSVTGVPTLDAMTIGNVPTASVI